MTYKYISDIDTIVYKNGNQTTLLNGTAFRQFCTQHGIVMKTSKDFVQYMQIKNRYIPKEIYGII